MPNTIIGGKLEIPNTVEKDGKTYKVKEIVGKSYNESTFRNVKGLDNSSVEVVIPENIINIQDYAFIGASWVKSVTFTENSKLDKIFSHAFRNMNLTEITLPNSLTKLGSHIFNGSKNLKNIYLGTGITTPAKDSFSGLSNDITIHIPDSAPMLTSMATDVVTARENISGYLSVYGDYQGVRYEQIRGTANVSAITITDFDAATRTEILWPGGQKELESGGKSKTDTIFEIPSKVTLADNAEYTVTKIEGQEYKPDNNFSEMKKEGFFKYRDKITKVILPETVKEIGKCAFFRFGSTDAVADFRINIPRGLTKMGERAFQYCAFLKTINIPGTLKEIPMGAFANCDFMKEVVIGEGVEKIGSAAFSNCGKRAKEVSTSKNENISVSVLVPGTVTNVNWNSVFSGVDPKITQFYTNSEAIKTDITTAFTDANVKIVNNYGKSLKLLSIGNSFSRNTMENLYHIALDQGFTDIELGYFYYPGASITRHWKMATNADALKNASKNVDELTKYHYFRWENNGWYDYSMSAEEAQAWIDNPETAKVKPSDIFSYGVKDAAWDIIDFQLSSIEADGQPLDKLSELIDIVDGLKTNTAVKYGCLQTWAFAEDSTHGQYVLQYKDKGKTPIDQYNDIITNSKVILNDYKDKITYFIPSGTAVQNMRTTYVGDTLNGDGYHLNMTGSYISSMTLLKELTGVAIDNVTYITDTTKMSADDLKFAPWAVNSAVEKPLEITETAAENQYKITVEKGENDTAIINALCRAYSKPTVIKAEYEGGALKGAVVTALKRGENVVEGLNDSTTLFVWDLANGLKPLTE